MITISKILRKKLFTALGSIFLSASAQSCDGQSMTYEQLKDNLEVQLELITKRELSEEELEKAAKEYYALFDNTCDSLCVSVVKYNNEMVLPMQQKPGEPMDLLRRHYYSTRLYLSPTQAGSFIQQLTNEIDPIRVADPKSSRVLKQSDILGFLNINAFVKNGEGPQTIAFDSETIDAIVSEFQQRYVEDVTKLPHRLSLSAELWAGITQNWDKLSTKEKQQVKNYFNPSSDAPIMQQSTYKNLLSLTDDEAADWRSQDNFEYQIARLEALGNQILDYYASKIEIEILWGTWW